MYDKTNKVVLVQCHDNTLVAIVSTLCVKVLTLVERQKCVVMINLITSSCMCMYQMSIEGVYRGDNRHETGNIFCRKIQFKNDTISLFCIMCFYTTKCVHCMEYDCKGKEVHTKTT